MPTFLYVPSEQNDSRGYTSKTEIKSRRMRWAGHVARMGGEERRIQGFGGETRRKEDHWGDPGVDGRIILRWIFRKWDVEVWNGSSWLRIGTGDGHL